MWRKNVNEVRYIDTSYQKGPGGIVSKNSWDEVEKQEPIRNNERIRVFHGCDLKTAVTFAKQGLSGKQRHPRKYSYENGMNPIGLFVSTDFETVKEFSNPFNGGKNKKASVIIEFTANSNDLDTPVWNNASTYFGQGSNPIPFRNKDERDRQKRDYNSEARNSEFKHIKDSDNPAMAKNIFLNREHQALFIGDLSPNMIKRFWVKKYDNSNSAIDKQYIPMKLGQFIKEFGNEEFYDHNRSTFNSRYYGKIDGGDKLFLPNENFTSLEDMAIRKIRTFSKRNPKLYKNSVKRFNGNEREYIKSKVEQAVKEYEYGINHDCIDYFESIMWPKQLIQLLGKEKYMEYFDNLGIGLKNEGIEHLIRQITESTLQKLRNL